jgi:ACS family tartrate transporter-like MFS transporter
MAFIRGPLSFYILRFLLGLAEAGFFPGVILYLGYWFPARYRSAVIALFMAAAPIAGVFGSPISGALLGMHGVLGLKGWQWLFLMEGIPAVLLGFVTMVFLPDKPEKATWLADHERTWLVNAMQAEEKRNMVAEHSVWRALIDWRVLTLALAYFGTAAGLYTVGIWAPLLVKNLGFSTVMVGFLVAIPNLVAVVGMLLWSWSSDHTGERYYHAAIACLVAAAGMAIAAKGGSSAVMAIVGLSLTAFGVSAAKPPLWTLPTKFFAGKGAAASIGLINSLGTLGGFAGPYMIGSTVKANTDFSVGLYWVGGSLVVSAITIIVLRFVVNRPVVAPLAEATE